MYSPGSDYKESDGHWFPPSLQKELWRTSAFAMLGPALLLLPNKLLPLVSFARLHSFLVLLWKTISDTSAGLQKYGRERTLTSDSTQHGHIANFAHSAIQRR